MCYTYAGVKSKEIIFYKLSVFNLCNVELLQRTALVGSSFVLRRYL